MLGSRGAAQTFITPGFETTHSSSLKGCRHGSRYIRWGIIISLALRPPYCTRWYISYFSFSSPVRCVFQKMEASFSAPVSSNSNIHYLTVVSHIFLISDCSMLPKQTIYNSHCNIQRGLGSEKQSNWCYSNRESHLIWWDLTWIIKPRNVPPLDTGPDASGTSSGTIKLLQDFGWLAIKKRTACCSQV